MNMNEMKHQNANDIPERHECEHEGYEYYRKTFLAHGDAPHTNISIYRVPPRKAAYPYHFHHKNEETYYIISGHGTLRTPLGEREVVAGDLLYFPTSEAGTHKLTNSSSDEDLVYIDFDAVHDIDIAVYPDSNKIGICGRGINKLYGMHDNIDYYKGE